MGVRKFRSVQEMPGPAARTPLDPDNLRIVFGLMSLTHSLARVKHAPGLRRFRSWDEALAWRMCERAESAARSECEPERGQR